MDDQARPRARLRPRESRRGRSGLGVAPARRCRHRRGPRTSARNGCGRRRARGPQGGLGGGRPPSDRGGLRAWPKSACWPRRADGRRSSRSSMRPTWCRGARTAEFHERTGLAVGPAGFLRLEFVGPAGRLPFLPALSPRPDRDYLRPGGARRGEARRGREYINRIIIFFEFTNLTVLTNLTRILKMAGKFAGRVLGFRGAARRIAARPFRRRSDFVAEHPD